MQTGERFVSMRAPKQCEKSCKKLEGENESRVEELSRFITSKYSNSDHI
jgi:hypothetical protein